MLYILPNAITLASVFCGFRAITVVALDNPTLDDFFKAAIYLTCALLFDLLDGRVARMTRTQSAFGLQLDSLADVMSFGVAPALLVYKWVLIRHPLPGLFVAFLFIACGAMRLARFNVLSSAPGGKPSKPSKYMVGLPIPPASGVLISLMLANHAVGGALSDVRHTFAIFATTVVLSLLMVSNLPFRSFKDLKLSGGTVLAVLFAVGSSAVVWQFTKPPFVLLWLLTCYLVVGVVESLRLLVVHGSLRPSTETEPPRRPSDAPTEGDRSGRSKSEPLQPEPKQG